MPYDDDLFIDGWLDDREYYWDDAEQFELNQLALDRDYEGEYDVDDEYEGYEAEYDPDLENELV